MKPFEQGSGVWTLYCRGRQIPGLSLCVTLSLFAWAQDSKAPGPRPTPSAPNSGGFPTIAVNGDAILQHLNRVISWYRQSTSGVRSVGLPSDTIYQDNAKTLGSRVVRLAFQSAKDEAVIAQAQQKSSAGTPAHETSQVQSLTQMQEKVSAQIDQIQSQIQDIDLQVSKTRGQQRETLVSKRQALQGELDLQMALLDAVQKMATFVETNGETAAGLEGSINQLAKSVPEVLGAPIVPEKPVTASAAAKPSLANSGGLISEAVTLYDYMTAVHQIDTIIKETNDTREVADRLRTPLRDAVRETIKQSQALASETLPTDPQQLQTERETFQQITERFKKLSSALLPLSQEVIVLNDAKTNLEEWRSSIARESRHVLQSVLIRVGAIVIALALILLLSEIWRRITFRYIADTRRRRQFLVLRRVVIGFLFVIVLLLGFVSEFSSLATFAGFITAGIAVGLQAVLLSVAAYFFIIGRYGIRVGDRISVAGVTGDVVDIGLVRFYLMEMSGTGVDFYPTGRLVVLSNAVLFQTGTPLFKQIPGTEYSWHELVIVIAPQGDHGAAQEKILATVNAVYSQYSQEIEMQHAGIVRRVDIFVPTPRPEARLQFSDAGLELLVRYPVDIRRAPDIDEEMTRRVLHLIETDPALKVAFSSSPKFRSTAK